MKPVPDCLTCGACCVAPYDQDAFANVEDKDLLRLGEKLVRLYVHAPIPKGCVTAPEIAVATKPRVMTRGPLKGDISCACKALRGNVGHRVSCAIYEQRPRVCRIALKPGDRVCREIRENMGLS